MLGEAASTNGKDKQKEEHIVTTVKASFFNQYRWYKYWLKKLVPYVVSMQDCFLHHTRGRGDQRSTKFHLMHTQKQIPLTIMCVCGCVGGGGGGGGEMKIWD